MFTLALPAGGRLAEPVQDLITRTGLDLERPPRVLQRSYPEQGLRVVFIRPKDAGKLLEAGLVDLAVSALDILAEYPAAVSVLQPLGLGKCRVAVLVRQDSPFHKLEDLEGGKLATSYPNLTSRWFSAQGIQLAQILSLHGSLEIAPWLAGCDAIVDSYQTGQSARVNHLRVLTTVMASEAVLIGRSGVAPSLFSAPVVRLLETIDQLVEAEAKER
jgi:ATP phosphoribosyltransferase